MNYYSTRNAQVKVSASQAIAGGLAPDGGLYVPSELPKLTLDEIMSMCPMDYRGRAAHIIAKFLPEYSGEEIEGFVTAAYGELAFTLLTMILMLSLLIHTKLI